MLWSLYTIVDHRRWDDGNDDDTLSLTTTIRWKFDQSVSTLHESSSTVFADTFSTKIENSYFHSDELIQGLLISIVLKGLQILLKKPTIIWLTTRICSALSFTTTKQWKVDQSVSTSGGNTSTLLDDTFSTKVENSDTFPTKLITATLLYKSWKSCLIRDERLSCELCPKQTSRNLTNSSCSCDDDWRPTIDLITEPRVEVLDNDPPPHLYSTIVTFDDISSPVGQQSQL